MKKTLILAITILMAASFASAEFQTKVGLELSSLEGINWIDNGDGDSVKVTIHNAADNGVVESRNASKGTYYPDSTITMVGDKFNLSYGTEYIYNLSTDYGNFYYNFTTPAAPSTGGAELHSGQTTSYGTAPDDADYDGTSKSYTDNEDGTVTDDHTGLMWQKDDASGTYNWEQAKSECDSLSLAGYNDWRLPSYVEAPTMLDMSCDSGTPSHCSSDLENNALTWDDCSDGYYWAGTTRPDDTDLAYRIGTHSGYVTSYVKNNNDVGVRCVRRES